VFFPSNFGIKSTTQTPVGFGPPKLYRLLFDENAEAK
jgi:hypothetical protein